MKHRVSVPVLFILALLAVSCRARREPEKPHETPAVLTAQHVPSQKVAAPATLPLKCTGLQLDGATFGDTHIVDKGAAEVYVNAGAALVSHRIERRKTTAFIVYRLFGSGFAALESLSVSSSGEPILIKTDTCWGTTAKGKIWIETPRDWYFGHFGSPFFYDLDNFESPGSSSFVAEKASASGVAEPACRAGAELSSPITFAWMGDESFQVLTLSGDGRVSALWYHRGKSNEPLLREGRGCWETSEKGKRVARIVYPNEPVTMVSGDDQRMEGSVGNDRVEYLRVAQEAHE